MGSVGSDPDEVVVGVARDSVVGESRHLWCELGCVCVRSFVCLLWYDSQREFQILT